MQPTQGVGFMNPPPPNVKASGAQPQVPGRMLVAKDISTNLKGRHAELFWPAGSKWYLIEIQVKQKSRLGGTSAYRKSEAWT